MNATCLQLLKDSIGQEVKITASDGQRLIAKVIFVDEERNDIVYDLVWTDRTSKYEKLDVQPVYSLSFYAITQVEKCVQPYNMNEKYDS